MTNSEKQSKSTTNLIIISNNFPLSNGESFLALEYPYLEKAFDSIKIIARSKSSEVKSHIYDAYHLPPQSSFLTKVKSIIDFLKSPKVNFTNINEELLFLRKKHLLDLKNIRTMLHDYFKALEIKNYIKTYHLNVQEKYIIYSYWQNAAALGGALLSQEKDNCKSICRAHGGDLYSYRTPNNYLSFRTYISTWNSATFFISKDGLKYQTSLLGKTYDSFKLARLGTEKHPNTSNKKIDKRKVIVSCSNIIKLKRIELIIEALALSSEKIIWYHFGDGKEAHNIKNLASKKLDKLKHINYCFKGHVSNKELLNFYATNHIDLFVNVSETEGIPVSIMEAMSFGIPALATDVGGTAELVNDSCGKLLPPLSSPKDIVEALEEELHTPKNKAAFTKWNIEYNASVNFNNFLKYLKNAH